MARDVWLVAGQALLRRGGIAAVKLTALTEELGLTTGSFYHHFDSVAAYHEELARYYGGEQVRSATEAIDAPDPRLRLRALFELSVDDMGSLDAAMRDWAGSYDVAAQAVRDADAVLLHFIERAFADLGCATADARVRAQLLHSAGVARVTPPWPLGRRAFDDVLAVLAP